MKNLLPLKTVLLKEVEGYKPYNSEEGYVAYIENVSVIQNKLNIQKIIDTLIKNHNNNIYKSCLKDLENKLRNIRNFEISINDTTKRLLDNYKEKYFNNYDLQKNNFDVLDVFITLIKDKNIKKIFNYKYLIKIKKQENKTINNIVFNFNNKNFRNLTGINDCWDVYLLAFIHFFIIILLVNIFKDNQYIIIKNSEHEFLNLVNYYCRYSIVGGMELYTEFDIGEHYGNLYQELTFLSPYNKYDMNFATSDENLSFDITIKNSLFLSKAYQKWKGGIWTNKDIGRKIHSATSDKKGYIITSNDITHLYPDKYMDSKDISTVRITKGKYPNIIKVNVKLSGMTIISRLLTISHDRKEKVYIEKLMTNWIFSIDNLVANFLWRVFTSTKQYKNNEKIPISLYSFFADFIKEYEQKRNLIIKTAVIIFLLMKTDEEREQLIKKYFKPNDTKQKAELRAKIKKLEKQIRKKHECHLALSRFIEGLEHYDW